MKKVFFSNKNVYGNLMLTTCTQISKNEQEEAYTEVLMLHRIKDLFSNQNEGRLLNCSKLGI